LEFSLTVTLGSRKKRENENDSYDVAAYIGILSFLWDVSCWWIRILVDGILSEDTLFNFSNFWEVYHEVRSTHSPGFDFNIIY